MIEEAVRAFEEAGARVEETNIEFGRGQRELCELWLREVAVKSAEIVSNLEDAGVADLLGEHREDLTPEFAALLDMGHAMGAVEYRKDEVARTEVFDAIQDLFDDYDLLVTSTLAVPPFDNAGDGNTLGPSGKRRGGDPLLGWCLTYPINFTGHPAASVPAGFTAEGCLSGCRSWAAGSTTGRCSPRAPPSSASGPGTTHATRWRRAGSNVGKVG